MAWIRDKKFRITDFFRHQDKRGEGMLMRDQFVEGMMASSMLHIFSFSTYANDTLAFYLRQPRCFRRYSEFFSVLGFRV